MPKLSCRCGYSFDLITIPPPEGYSIVPDTFFEEFGPESTANDVIDAVDTRTPEMYRCPACGRLAVFWERGSRSPVFYIVEDQ